jgi:TniQ
MIHWPELLPEEMVAGYIGRVARLNGISQQRLWRHLHEHETLVGKPGHLRTWVHALATTYPLDADALAGNHTLIPLLMVLRTQGSSMRMADPKSAAALHQSETALPDRGPRLCQACVEEDLGFWGFSYWRRNHQVRGVECCPKHGEPLLQVENPDGLALFPEECRGNDRQLMPAVAEPWRSRFTEMVTALMDLKNAIPSNQALYRALKRCELFQPRHHPNCMRAPLAHAVHRILHGSGLEQVFPTLLQARRKLQLTSHGSHTTHWTRSGTGYAYALALTALYTAPDEALRDALKPLNPEETDEIQRILPERAEHDLFRMN